MRQITFIALSILIVLPSCSSKSGLALREEVEALQQQLAVCQAEHSSCDLPDCPPCDCAGEDKKSASADTADLAPLDAWEPPAPPADTRVVLVSLDGFHTALITSMPHFQEMQSYGAWTVTARAPMPPITTVSHATMFTGVGPDKHGVTGQAPKGKVAKAAWRPLKVRTVFQRFDPQARRPTAFVQKRKLESLLPSDGLEVMLDKSKKERRIVEQACEAFRDPNGSRLTFVHLKRIDAVGHKHGWLSEKQREAAGKTDAALGRLSTCIAEGQELHGHPFALIVTSDHGGHGTTHGADRPGDREVPWLVIGPGIRKNFWIPADIPVRLEDTAVWIAYFLGDAVEDAPVDGAVNRALFE